MFGTNFRLILCWPKQQVSTEQHSIILACPITPAISREQDKWMSSDPDTPVGCKRPSTRSVTKALEKESATKLQPETSRRWSALSD